MTPPPPGNSLFTSIRDYLGLKDLVVLAIGGVMTLGIERWRDKAKQKEDEQRAAQQTCFSWQAMEHGAEAIGKKLRNYKPNVIITFAGSSSIFANLVLVKSLKRSDLLQIHLYTALFIDKNASSEIMLSPGFKVLESERFYILVPEALEREDKGSRILILDDTITTGSSMRAMKQHLKFLGHEHVKGACFVCYQGATLGNACTADWVYKTTTNADYTLPWGERL